MLNNIRSKEIMINEMLKVAENYFTAKDGSKHSTQQDANSANNRSGVFELGNVARGNTEKPKEQINKTTSTQRTQERGLKGMQDLVKQKIFPTDRTPFNVNNSNHQGFGEYLKRTGSSYTPSNINKSVSVKTTPSRFTQETNTFGKSSDIY